MSLSYLEWCRSSVRSRGLSVALTGLLGAGGSAVAAEVYVQPLAEVLVDVDSNRSLVTTGNTITSEGYSAQAGGILGVATPVSDSVIKAQVGYVDYPKDSDHELQGIVELRTDYHWERSEFTASGKFDRLNTFSSELASAIFDPIVPISPTTPETGRITTDTTRTLANLVPKYDYRLTERLSVGVSGTFESTDYSGAFASDYVSYNYGQGSVYLGWAVSPRFDVTFGPFVSRDSARTGGTSTDGVGAVAALNYKWSPTFEGRLDITGERDDSTLPQFTPTKVTSNAFGAAYSTTWKGQISSLQLSVGRTLTPSGAGGEYFADQLQVEYDRQLTPRLSSISAARVIRYTGSVAQAVNIPYKYADVTLGIKWLATRTWYVTTGLEYLRIDYGGGVGTGPSGLPITGAANNGRLFAGFGYEGLGRPQ
jgi:hypothetical protein